MKINAVFLNREKSNIIQLTNAKKNVLIFNTVFLSLCVIAGIAMLFLGKNNIYNEIGGCFNEYIQFIKTESKLRIFTSLLSGNLIFYIIIIFLSLNLAGKILVYIFSGIKIAGLSAVITYLYFEYNIKGIEYASMVFLPGKLVFILSVFIIMDLSSRLRNMVFNKNRENRTEYNTFLISIVGELILIVTCCATDTLAISLFSELFHF